jgi:uncharacterized protein (DUF488 family)
MTALVTIGYQDRTVDELIDTLDDAGAKVLVDVRLTPLSRKPGLSKHRLAARLREAGVDCVHLPQLGNPRDNRDAFRRHDAQALERYRAVLQTSEGRAALDQLARLARTRRVALLCFEQDARECHRRMVAEALAARCPGLTINHL